MNKPDRPDQDEAELDDLAAAPDANDELRDVADAIAAAATVDPELFAPPGTGAYRKAIDRRAVERAGVAPAPDPEAEPEVA